MASPLEQWNMISQLLPFIVKEQHLKHRDALAEVVVAESSGQRRIVDVDVERAEITAAIAAVGEVAESSASRSMVDDNAERAETAAAIAAVTAAIKSEEEQKARPL